MNYYHAFSRVVNRDFIFGDLEKEFFRRTMRKLEAFTGLRILTYCIMSNHWHILIEVPEISELNDDQLLERLRRFYSRSQFSQILKEYEQAKDRADDSWLESFRGRYIGRMGDLSIFVKELKERFSKWYNRKHNRRGTLWEERFKSVLVEDSHHTLAAMAAYIDLNPVRASIVGDPRNYRFCGYAEAVAGGAEAREGLSLLLRMHNQEASWRMISARYRTLLFSTGEQGDTKQGIDPEKVRKTLNDNGALKFHELLHCHIRYFNDGVALGSRLFIEEVFERNRSFFGARRKNGAREMQGGDWQGLYSMRNFPHNPVTAPG